MVPEDGDLAPRWRSCSPPASASSSPTCCRRTSWLADLPGAAEAIIFNGRAQDDVLRTDDLSGERLPHHPEPRDEGGRARPVPGLEALDRWFLIQGERPADQAFAEALRRPPTKFNGKIVEERTYAYAPTSRVTETGHVQVQRQMPVFTQDAPEYDVLLVADESDVFGEYLPYQTWDPRPVAGTQGLVPTAWHRAHEQWAGTQMQSRFENHAGRWMRERDYTAWLGVRGAGRGGDPHQQQRPQVLRDYLRGEQFELGAFKGEGLTFRPWNQQMRQPILLAAPRVLVSVSPQEGFLHQRTPLDSLGFDLPESNCRLE